MSNTSVSLVHHHVYENLWVELTTRTSRHVSVAAKNSPAVSHEYMIA